MRTTIENNLLTMADFKVGQMVRMIYAEPLGITDQVDMRNEAWKLTEIRRNSSMNARKYAYIGIVRDQYSNAKAVDLRDLEIVS